MKTLKILEAIVFFGLCACAPSPQETAYYAALKKEQDLAVAGGAVAIVSIVEYRNVIAMDPKSKWADRAQQRLDVVTKLYQDSQNARR
ncbi:MAG: hypothetical protein HZA93_00060 [Verrucomicrobia bacterium]|nr:hypothetical protein [Verrucomicrobiota bacterium]